MKDDDLFDLEHLEFLEEADADEPGFLGEMVQGFELNGKKFTSGIQKGLKEQDWEGVRFNAHKLSGVSGALGAKGLLELTRKVEENLLSGKEFLKVEGACLEILEIFECSLAQLKNKVIENSSVL